MSALSRTKRVVQGIGGEWAGSARSLTSGRPGYAVNVVASRALAVTERVPGRDGLHVVRSREGVVAHYRRNRGDIQSVREVLLNDVYRLPPSLAPRTVIDLGANIGLVSALYSSRYRPLTIVAVEPVPENVDIMRRNFAANDALVRVVDAAVGPTAGHGRFVVDSGASNLGHLGEIGDLEVSIVTMPQLIEMTGGDVDLVKLDIEGGEGSLLLNTDVSWLDDVGAVIAELHPEVIDYDAIVDTFTLRGFTHQSPGSLWPGSMTLFTRG